MKLEEAKAECERWLAHLDHQRERALNMQRIATAVRNGEIDQEEARRRVRRHDGITPVVYDGARLEQAVKLLLCEIRKKGKVT